MADADIITGKLTSSGRLDKALAEATELSRERIKGLIAEGAVTVGKTLARSASAKAIRASVSSGYRRRHCHRLAMAAFGFP